MLNQQNHRFRRFTGSDIQHTRVFQSLYLVRYLRVSYWQVSGNKIDEHVKQQFPSLLFFFWYICFPHKKSLTLNQNVRNTSPITLFLQLKTSRSRKWCSLFLKLKTSRKIVVFGDVIITVRVSSSAEKTLSELLWYSCTAVIVELSHHLRAGNYVSSL